MTIHEAIHNTVFGDPTLNKLNALFFADLPGVFRLRWHSAAICGTIHLNSYRHDADVPSDWDSRS